MATTTITYRFVFQDGRVSEQEVVLDAESGLRVTVPMDRPPDWTDLEYEKCRHCPLRQNEHPECPVARDLAPVVEAFKDEQSFEKVSVEVLTAERIYRKDVSLQDGLYSLVGLIMATGGCPHMDFLRPMARYHLPFATSKETTARSVAFYLLRQYFVAREGGQPDHDLAEFQKLYDAVGEVNAGMAARLRAASRSDAHTNSIIVLDTFAQLLSNQLTHKLSGLEKLFSGD